MPKCAFPGTVEIVDTEEKAVVACAYLMAQSALGFDTETRPSQMKFVREVARVLESGNVVKVGAAVRDDIKGLQKLRWFRPQGFVDLQSVAGEWGIEEKSVRKLAAIVLGSSVSKAQRLSNWEAATLTKAQIGYAATDAWVCLEIYNRLMKEPR